MAPTAAQAEMENLLEMRLLPRGGHPARATDPDEATPLSRHLQHLLNNQAVSAFI
ncbi:hypothetical protein RGR602_CH02291 [Rhizobium gallicum bv. gallicum R602sp]|uniref:Uncharacterized protein n=1 Tax=Rhizobium gallicum bv. gallicum R602sp TaxID=1041138 RepID=A0A0B4X531_9HYPH|nr:hypothetical protein RGR602_CH02291 [Rhizobium gallicum bv. gallicum R602sp]